MSENEEKIEIFKCACCHTHFSKETIEKVKENKETLFCECCGARINKQDSASRITPITNDTGVLRLDSDNVPETPMAKETTNAPVARDTKKEENPPEELPTNEEIIEQFKIFVVRRAYQVLKEYQYNIEMEKDQKEPDAYQLKELARILRSKIINLTFEEEWLAELSPARRKAFDLYSKIVANYLKNKKFYREHYKDFFQETMLWVFRLIKSLPDDTIDDKTRLETLMDLKRAFGFALYENARHTFEFQLTAFVASEIYYSKIFRESVLQCNDTPGEIDRAVEKFALEVFRSFDQQEFLYKYANTLKWKHKVKFKIKLNNLRSEAKDDHVFCESFIDYLIWLTRAVLELVRGVDYSQLDDMKRDILEFLLSTRPFLSDRDLQSSFVPNFRIVLCRIMCSTWSKKDRAQWTEPRAKAIEDDLLTNLSTKKIRREFLTDLREISQDDFERNYGKFQLKMKRDQIYRASFKHFLRSLVDTAFKLIRGKYDPKTLSASEWIILQDLQKFKETPAAKGELTPLNFDSLDEEKSCSQTGESKSLATRATELPDIEEIFIVASDSKKHAVTAIVDTGASIRESLLDLELARRLGLEIDFNTQKLVSISGNELKGHPCKATILFRSTPMTIEFLTIEKLQEHVLNYSELISFPALISKPTLLKYSELTGQDGKIVLDLKDQYTNINNLSTPEALMTDNANFSDEKKNTELLVLKMSKNKKKEFTTIKARSFSLFPCGVFPSSKKRDAFIQSDSLNFVSHYPSKRSQDPDRTKEMQKLKQELSQAFTRVQDLQNLFLEKMLEIASNRDNLPFFQRSSVESQQKIYNKFGLSALDAEFSERIRRYCLQNPFHAVRNYLIRNHDLHNIADCLVSYLAKRHENSNSELQSFLYEKSPDAFDRSIFTSLGRDVFGEKQELSKYFLHNMLGQIRNISCSQLDSRLDSSFLLESLSDIFKTLRFSQQNETELLETAISKFSRQMSSYFTYVIHKRKEEFKDFKRVIDKFRKEISAKLRSTMLTSFSALREKAFQSEVKYLKQYSFAGFFSEFLPRARLRFGEYHDAFSRNLDNLDRYKSDFFKIFTRDFKRFALSFYHSVLKEKLVAEFINRYYDKIVTTLDFIRQSDITTLVSTPKIRSISLPANSRENFQYINRRGFGSQSVNYVQLSIFPRRIFLFRIIDKKNIIKKMFRSRKVSTPRQAQRDDNDNMGYPTITFREFVQHDRKKNQQIKKFAKIKLHVPFEFPKEANRENLFAVCVDLNIKRFAVISVINKKSHKTVAIFFIHQRELFDMKFVVSRKKFVFRNRFDDWKNPKEKARRNTNIFRKLYILRKRADKWQSLSKSSETSDSDRKLYLALYSQTWLHIRNINREIVRTLSSAIVKIALAYGADIEMEFLKWHVAKSKRTSGKFLAFWNVHFLFSQIEDATARTAKSRGIPFRYKNPRGTSARCSKCGAVGTLNGRMFSCKKCGLITNRDINATRNIHIAEEIKVS